ncbi:MAG TPA: hypothetical protein VFN10_23105 [Thermoanaerobaculia bacterium]|nr:hypothetical protein [Thermoanaerobaculia bacterium]
MGDETKETEFEKGNTHPRSAPLKPSTAEGIEEEAPEIAQVPRKEDELPRNDGRGRE